MEKSKRIVIRPYGHTANNMIEHMLALYLRSCVPELKIYCDSASFLRLFGLHFEMEPESSRQDSNCSKIIINRPGFKVLDLIKVVKSAPNIKVIIEYCHFDHDCYKGLLPSFRQIYGNKSNINGFGGDYLVISIRLGDILNSPIIHPNYPVVPISFYRFLLRKTGLKPVFLGQIGDDPISTALKTEYPHAIFLSGREVILDFECLRRSKNMTVAVSTFSFLAGYLSENTVLHVPLYGFMNQRDRPDLNYIVKSPRYHYYEFPSIKWTASTDQIKEVISDKDIEYKEITDS